MSASEFSVENCSALALLGGRVAAVYTNTPAPTGSDCTVHLSNLLNLYKTLNVDLHKGAREPPLARLNLLL